MDPGIANGASSGLDEQLASADVAILSSVWDSWSEPNDSRKFGSTKSTRVLHRDFCRAGSFGRHPRDGVPLYELWVRKSSGRCAT